MARRLRPVVVAVAVPLALFLVEWPYNQLLFGMAWEHVLLNLALLGAFVLSVWFLCQRRMASLIAAEAACLLLGMTDYVMMMFKGTTVLPSDLMAISTAAQVSDGYALILDDRALLPLVAFLALACIAVVLPNPNLTRARVLANVAIGLGLICGLVWWYKTTDIEENYSVKVDVWDSAGSYRQYGAVPCFLQRMQEITLDPPAGYSKEGAEDLVAELAAEWDASHPGYPATIDEYLSLSGLTQMPHVICIMDESFSNMALYPGVEGYEGTDIVDSLDTELSGTLYVSARGGGTCNTEFEFLTGSTLGMLGGGVYPYMFYSFEGVESLPSDMAGLGYTTSAIHPCDATNWRRDVVYRQLGFDAFYSADSFGSNAQTLRGKVTDKETYRLALEIVEGSDRPQFIFDVTYMGHGGYDTGLLDEYPYQDVTVNGQPIDGMSEYLSLMDAAEEDVEWLLGELLQLDEPVVVVFFGDHQPGFNDEVSSAAYGDADHGIEGVQQRFSTQYFIWTNYSTDNGWTAFDLDSTIDLSVNYLAAISMYELGMPLTDLQKAELYLFRDMPATNMNGYRSAEGTWYWNGSNSPLKDVYDEYALIQYANLFQD